MLKKRTEKKQLWTTFSVISECWMRSRSVESGLCDCLEYWSNCGGSTVWLRPMHWEDRTTNKIRTMQSYSECLLLVYQLSQQSTFAHTLMTQVPLKYAQKLYIYTHIYIYIHINFIHIHFIYTYKNISECTLQKDSEEFERCHRAQRLNLN